MKSNYTNWYKWIAAGMAFAFVFILSCFGVSRTEVEASEIGIENPLIEEDNEMEAGQLVTWNTIWFGSYPQSEVTSETDAGLYKELTDATGWINNEITLDGEKYRRITKSDATYATTGNQYFYDWTGQDETTYHYFKYEPIKWRVLNVDNGKALLLSHIALDDQRYHSVNGDITWEDSSIRSWLNSTFLNAAFPSSYQNAILTTEVKNSPNIAYGISGGNDTKDKVFLLSDAEVYSTEQAESYGFSASRDVLDEGRRMLSSEYAKIMGLPTPTDDIYKKFCTWWTRSPGIGYSLGATTSTTSYNVTQIQYDGKILRDGQNAYLNSGNGVCPVVTLDLAYTDFYSIAGEESSDGSGGEYPYTKEHDVSYKANGSGVDNLPENQKKIEGTSLKLSEKVPTRTQYIFKGWSTSPSTGTVSYQPGDSYKINEDLILYAVWDVIPTYTITYDANGGKGAPDTQTKIQDEALTLSTDKPTRADYTFLGWSTNAAASSAEYQPGDKYTLNNAAVLYAVWKQDTPAAAQGTTVPATENPTTTASAPAATTTTAEVKTQTITAKSKTVAYKSKAFSLNAKASGGGKLTYSTSNKKVAAVSSNGKVTVKNYGQATITIKAAAKGDYPAATKKITVKVVPKKMSLKSPVSSKKRTIKVSWKKDKTVTGYQMHLSAKKNFKTETFQRKYNKSTLKMTTGGLKSKKTYYVRIRAYKKVGSKYYYGAWSKVKKVKIK
ncbi:MAG: DUF6273 domain-containing protein [Lachnospiraceae bacterium]|nr:DUF6273 domain-containing protein [Lachnospiraceae bacterium]